MLLCCSEFSDTCTHRNMHAHTRSIKTRLCCTYFVCCITNDETLASTCKSGSRCTFLTNLVAFHFSIGFILFSCSFHFSFKMSNLFFFILSAHHGHPVDLSTNFRTEHFQPGVSPFLVTDSFMSVSVEQIPVRSLFSDSSPPKLHFDTWRPTFPPLF